MSAEQCGGCRFWRLDAKTADPNDDDWGFGFCRKEPPTLVGQLAAMQVCQPAWGESAADTADMVDTTDLLRATRYPVTDITDWCGRFEGFTAPQPSASAGKGR